MRHASEFAKDLEELSPLSKLRGINLNRQAGKRLPNLTQITKEYVEDLQYASEALLTPSVAI